MVVLLLAVSAPSALAQQADDPVVTIRLRYSQWLAIGRLVEQQKIADFGALYSDVQSQMTAQAQGQQKAAIDAFEKQIRDKVEAETRAKAESKEPQP